MTTRIYDSSQLIKRRAEKAIAGSFSPNNTTGSASYLGITSDSIITAVKSGHTTQYTKFGSCYGISPGCPCSELNTSISTPPFIPAIPGTISVSTITVGSIIISWNAPTIGDGPFTYIITPYLNGSALPSVTTTMLSYRFTDLPELQPCTFEICATNASGTGPLVKSSYFLSPPAELSMIMNGLFISINPEQSLKYIVNNGLNSMLQYISTVNLGPTKGSRYIYLWITSVVGAWNWVRSESRITDIHDNWNWNSKVSPLSDNDSLIWICNIIDHITPFFIPGKHVSIYNCPDNVIARVKSAGGWNTWQLAWKTWYDNRLLDGVSNASTEQPRLSANWNTTINVDGTTVNNISDFPNKYQWTPLIVQGKKQGYLTYTWDSVLSSCLTEQNEITIQQSVSPISPNLPDSPESAARNAEVDAVKDMTAVLTDEQKIIAEFWAGGPGTVSPPLMFIWLWKEYIKTIKVSCTNIMFSLHDLAVHLFEGSRVTWRLKAAHMEARPIQEIRRRYAGQSISSWNGTISGEQWIPYQEANFVTPPFADFPSGHSHFSKAFALTMNKWFTSNITKNNTFYDKKTLICPLFTVNDNSVYGDFKISSGASKIESGIVPHIPLTLSFNTWDAMADQAGISRLYGGIHCMSAHTASQNVATQVDALINNTWNIQTS